MEAAAEIKIPQGIAFVVLEKNFMGDYEQILSALVVAEVDFIIGQQKNLI
jgi:hypothetical protein